LYGVITTWFKNWGNNTKAIEVPKPATGLDSPSPLPPKEEEDEKEGSTERELIPQGERENAQKVKTS